jgi:hypothetical protein
VVTALFVSERIGTLAASAGNCNYLGLSILNGIGDDVGDKSRAGNSKPNLRIHGIPSLVIVLDDVSA